MGQLDIIGDNLAIFDRIPDQKGDPFVLHRYAALGEKD